jgi:hypothetical protein
MAAGLDDAADVVPLAARSGSSIGLRAAAAEELAELAQPLPLTAEGEVDDVSRHRLDASADKSRRRACAA